MLVLSGPGIKGQYRVVLLEVAGDDYFLKDPSDYRIDIRR